MRLREDSLDDYDIDGSIRKDRDNQPEAVKAVCKKLIDIYYNAVKDICQEVLTDDFGLKFSPRSLSGGKYVIYYDDTFYGAYKPGKRASFDVYIGQYYGAHFPMEVAERFEFEYDFEIDRDATLRNGDLAQFVEKRIVPKMVQLKNNWAMENEGYILDVEDPRTAVSVKGNDFSGTLTGNHSYMIHFEFKMPDDFDLLYENRKRRVREGCTYTQKNRRPLREGRMRNHPIGDANWRR